MSVTQRNNCHKYFCVMLNNPFSEFQEMLVQVGRDVQVLNFISLYDRAVSRRCDVAVTVLQLAWISS
jgi:hypothetical protein